MTSIQAYYCGDGYRIAAHGHATGSLEACSGISAILYALAGWLKGSGLRYEVCLSSGAAMIAFQEDEGARTAMDFATIGLAQIANTEPETSEITVTRE